MVNAFIVNAIDHGYDYNVDPNSDKLALPNTVSYTQYSKQSVLECFIDKLRKSRKSKKAQNKGNGQMVLDVVFNTKVNKLIFDRHSEPKHVALGVEVTWNGTKRTVYSSKEIVVSAGTVESPQLLMRSGFGDLEHLKDCCDVVGIEENMEIGRNLLDQIKFSLYFRAKPDFKVMTKREIEKWKYSLFGGTMVNSSGYDANIYYGDKLQFSFLNGIKPIAVRDKDGAHCMDTDIVDGVSIDVVLLHPKSTGFIELTSNGTTIDPRYLSDEE